MVGKGGRGGNGSSKNSGVGGNNGRGNSDGGSRGNPTLGTFLNGQRQLTEKRRPGSARRGSEKSGEGGEGGGGGGGGSIMAVVGTAARAWTGCSVGAVTAIGTEHSA